VAMVYTDLAHQPHFQVEYADWKLDPTLPDSTFALPLPRGAIRVEFRAAAAAFR
jgi:outer membrane lipoprotein-sorting protein